MLTRKAKRPSNAVLPLDVIQQILLRLPVKSLCKFKSVCKEWGNLIGSPIFVDQHFHHNSNQERLLIRHSGPVNRRYAFALYVDEMYSRYEEPDHLQIPDSVYALMGPINGVFCVVNASLDMALLNPAMRQFRPLPLLDSNLEPHLEVNYYSFGFGLDPLNGDYKIVLSQFLQDVKEDDPEYPLVSVYNSGSDSWKFLEDADLLNAAKLVNRSPFNTYLNGKYYWLMTLEGADPLTLEGGDALAVLAFDMSSEEFQQIQVPDCIIDSSERVPLLALYRNSIALLLHNFPFKDDKFLDVWILEKDECWVRSYIVGPLHQNFCWPIGFLKDNELLFETETSSLILYDISTDNSRTVEAREQTYGDRFMFWTFSYKESIVSVEGKGDSCKVWDTSSQLVKDFFK